MPSIRALLLVASPGVLAGCPGDDVPTGGDTTGSQTTSDSETSGSMSSPSTTNVTTSTTGDTDEGSSSGGPTTSETDSTSSSSGGGSESTTTGEETTSSGSSSGEESSSSGEESSSSTGEPPDQDCPYGELMVPDSVSDSTLGEDSEFSSSCGGNGAPDVSYTLTAPADGVYVIDTFGSSIDTILAVFDGECGGLEIACNNDDPLQDPDSMVSVELTAGQTVTVVADGFSVMGGAVMINVAFYEGICPNGDLGNTVPQSTAGSTAASDNTVFGSCGGNQAPDETFTFVAPEPGIYTFDTLGSDFDTVLYVRDECLGTELACNDNGPVGTTSSVSLPMVMDQSVVVVVDGDGLQSGNYNVNVDIDSCPDADLGSTVPQSVSGSTVGLVDQADSSCASDGTAPDVAYTFTAPIADTYIIDTELSALDTILHVYDGASCGGTLLACDDQGGVSGNSSRVSLSLAAGQEITIIVDGYLGGSGTYNLNIDDACGDDVISAGEFCDGFSIGESSCEDLGYAGGSLDCADDCEAFDESECSNGIVAVCSSPGSAITDLATTMDTIDVPDMGAIADVDLFLDITHTWVGDLDIVLEADDLALANNVMLDQCEGGQNDVWAFFNDEGNGAAGSSCVEPNAVEGNVIPLQALSVYDSGEANGSWTLSIYDDAGADQGTLNQWCLYFTVE